MSLILRKVIAADNQVLAQIIRSVFNEFNGPKTGTVYSDPTTDFLFDFFETTERAELFVAVEDDNILGCCGIYPTKGLPKNYVELVKFYLTKDARGKGVGSALFQKSIDAARNLKFSHVYIESLPNFNKAVKMYKNYGFDIINQSLGNSGHENCNIWMLKKI